MTNIIHSGVWEGPCRFTVMTPAEEEAHAQANFKRWVQGAEKELRNLLPPGDIEILEPAHLTFSEDFVLKPDQLAKLQKDSRETDVYLVAPHGSSIATFEIGNRFHKPIILRGLNCRTVDISAYSRSKGVEVFVPDSVQELKTLVSLLRARKVFSHTRILFPTDRGLPAVASLAGINEPDELRERLGVQVQTIPYRELTQEVQRVLKSPRENRWADSLARELIGHADKSYLDDRYVVRGLEFYNAIRKLMVRHRSNAFTIECFEFCSSKLPDEWEVTPCLIHTLFKDQGIASACEADMGALLSMRLLMSVSEKSSHLGNMFLRGGNTLVVNHSAPGTKMNGYDRPALPYQLGRFVHSGWGTKAVVDFMNNAEKLVTVARMDPTATRVLLMKGRLVGSDGWGADKLGCSVEAHIRPAETGNAEPFVRKQKDYGNHLVWVYGDYTDEVEQLCGMLGLKTDVVT
jgi:L-fucose isomerase-like protein